MRTLQEYIHKMRQSLSQTGVGSLILWILIVNIIFVVAVLVLNTFVDAEELAGRLPLGEGIEYQAVVITVLSVIEILLLIVVVWRWTLRRSIATKSLQNLISEGEHEQVEFKASLRWDYEENRVNKGLEYAVARTVSGFMNTQGGVLLIGVTDEGIIQGLAKDYQTLKKSNSDGFILHLTSVLHTYLGKEYTHFVSSRVLAVRDTEVCKVDVRPASRPVYLHNKTQEEFFIRSGASTQPMQIREAHEYIAMHWPQNKKNLQ